MALKSVPQPQGPQTPREVVHCQQLSANRGQRSQQTDRRFRGLEDLMVLEVLHHSTHKAARPQKTERAAGGIQVTGPATVICSLEHDKGRYIFPLQLPPLLLPGNCPLHPTTSFKPMEGNKESSFITDFKREFTEQAKEGSTVTSQQELHNRPQGRATLSYWTLFQMLRVLSPPGYPSHPQEPVVAHSDQVSGHVTAENRELYSSVQCCMLK